MYMFPVRRIVAIGGGEIKILETLKIDREIVRLTGKSAPKALFIPTASEDADGYWKTFQKIYKGRLGCKTDVLLLIREKPTRREIAKKILSSDLIYVGGGNTFKMLRIWKQYDVPQYLRRTWNNGVILSGLSAGSICWFKFGQSDSPQFTNPKDPKLIKIKALGFIDALHCPHYFREKYRHKHFEALVKKGNQVGLAIDDNCAVIFENDKFRIVSSKPGMGAYRLFRKGGRIIKERIKENSFQCSTRKLLETPLYS
jgi:dipeptidase E